MLTAIATRPVSVRALTVFGALTVALMLAVAALTAVTLSVLAPHAVGLGDADQMWHYALGLMNHMMHL